MKYEDFRKSRPSTRRVEAVVFTRADVIAMVAKSEHVNRTLKAKKIAIFLSLMLQGKWNLGENIICMTRDGVLKNGHHRMQAFLQSNLPSIEMFVRFVDNPVEFNCMDTGTARSISDASRCIGIDKIDSRLQSYINATVTHGWNNSKVDTSNQALLEFYEKHKTAFTFVYDLFEAKCKVPPVTVAAFILAKINMARRDIESKDFQISNNKLVIAAMCVQGKYIEAKEKIREEGWYEELGCSSNDSVLDKRLSSLQLLRNSLFMNRPSKEGKYGGQARQKIYNISEKCLHGFFTNHPVKNKNSVPAKIYRLPKDVQELAVKKSENTVLLYKLLQLRTECVKNEVIGLKELSELVSDETKSFIAKDFKNLFDGRPSIDLTDCAVESVIEKKQLVGVKFV